MCSSDLNCETGYNNNNSVGICEKNEGGGGGSSVGVIVGVVVGVVVLIGIITFIILPNHNNKDKDKNDGDEVDGLEVLNEIGHGATSVVYKGRYGGKDVAVKVMKQDVGGGGGFDREMELMMRLKNPFIIEVYEKCVLSGHVGYVMEYVGMGSLLDVMSKQVFSDGLKMRYGREICLGMRYLHSMNIIHRDLKLETSLF